MRITVLGASGMAGGMVVRYLSDNGYDVSAITRKELNVSTKADMYREVNHVISAYEPEYVINCIGAIKPMFKGDIIDAIYTNAIFPRILADVCDDLYSSLIHITTDCVFSGTTGKYTENSFHDPLDDYGKSKSLGEPIFCGCMVLRTSIIGPEWNGNKRSPVEWFLSKKGEEVNGFTNHFGNGITTLQLAKYVDKIIKDDLYENGIFHIFSHDINKQELLSLMDYIWHLDIKVNPIEAIPACNRTLRTNKDLMTKLGMVDIDLMLLDMKKYIYNR